MNLTSRRKRPLEREEKTLKDARLIVIATEGKHTEKLYFENDFFDKRRVRVKVLPTLDGNSAPQHVFDRINDFIKHYELAEQDQIWIVVDKDRFKDYILGEIKQKTNRIRSIKSEMVISRPCFEIWFYLHFFDKNAVHKLTSCRSVINKLKERLGSYNKKKPPLDKLFLLTEQAIQRASELDDGSDIPMSNSSQVYKLVKELINLGKL